MLTFYSQKELAINARATVSTIRRDIKNTHTVVSDVRNDVENAHAIVSDIYRKRLKSPNDTHSQNRIVSTIRTLPVTG